MNAEIRTRTLLVKSLVRGVVDLATLGGVLFGIAGRVDWPGRVAHHIAVYRSSGSQRMVAVSS